MKTLIVAGVLPGSQNVGSIILRDLLASLPSSDWPCYAIIGGAAPDTVSSTRNVRQHVFIDDLTRKRRPGLVDAVFSSIFTFTVYRIRLKRLTSEIVSFAQDAGVERVLSVADTPSIITMGPEVAQQLQVPLVSLIWDPPGYLLQSRGWDRSSRQYGLRRFRALLKGSERVGVVSEAMCAEYGSLTRDGAIILRHARAATPPHSLDTPEVGSVTIGFAGSLYAASAWRAFIQALDHLDWKVGGRNVSVKLLGTHFDLKMNGPARIESLGWRSEDETQAILSGCDIIYLPMPFEGHLSEFTRFSFPTKLSAYVATGRPVFVHAPEYSALRPFIGRHPVGPFCSSLDPSDIAGQLASFLTDETEMTQAAKVSIDLSQTELSVNNFRSQAVELLGICREEGRS